MPYPDVEQVLTGWLSAHLGVRTVTDTPANLAQVLPIIQVTRFGGTDRFPGIDTANVDIDCYAATRLASAILADNVRYALRFVLCGQHVDDVTVARVDTISAPSWRPYDNTTLRRHGATYQLILHAKTIREVTP